MLKIHLKKRNSVPLSLSTQLFKTELSSAFASFDSLESYSLSFPHPCPSHCFSLYIGIVYISYARCDSLLLRPASLPLSFCRFTTPLLACPFVVRSDSPVRPGRLFAGPSVHHSIQFPLDAPREPPLPVRREKKPLAPLL